MPATITDLTAYRTQRNAAQSARDVDARLIAALRCDRADPHLRFEALTAYEAQLEMTGASS